MARKTNKKFRAHADWNIPGGVKNMDGEPVKVLYHQPDPAQSKKRKAVNHKNAMDKLRAQQAKMASA